MSPKQLVFANGSAVDKGGAECVPEEAAAAAGGSGSAYLALMIPENMGG